MFRPISCIVTIAVICAVVALPSLASGPSLEGFENQKDLISAIDDFMGWFTREYNHHSATLIVDTARRSQQRKGQLSVDPLRVTLAYAGSSLRLGVFATETIAAEQPYLSVPHAMIIYKDTIEATVNGLSDGSVEGDANRAEVPGIGTLLRSLWGKVNAPGLDRFQASLALFLLHEKFVAGSQSYFYHYIRLLPAKHDTPDFYTDEELSLLNGTTVYRKVFTRRARHRAQYDWLQSHIFDVYSDKFPPTVATLDNWRWVMGVLDSRMIWWEGQPHLVPLLDMVNCAQIASRPKRIHSTFRRGDNAVTLSPVTFKAGDQLFENYGQPNPTYYFYHGFVMTPNWKDCAEMDLTAHFPTQTPAQRRARDTLVQKLRSMRVDVSELCLTRESSSIEQLMIASRMFVAKDEDLAADPRAPTYANRPTPMRTPYSDPFEDSALERRSIIFAGRAVNSTLGLLASGMERAAHVGESVEQEKSELTVSGGGGLPQPTPSASFRLVMTHKYLTTQHQILQGVRSVLRNKLKEIPSSQKDRRDPLTTRKGDDDSAKGEL